MEPEINKSMSFMFWTPSKMHWINLTKYVKDVYTEIYKTFLKEIKENLNMHTMFMSQKTQYC